MVLDQIQNVNDIKNLTEEEIDTLQDEICTFLVESIAKTGGHLASNLGVIELTMALHLSFDLTKDKIVWDVGHQSYVHKILTGRRDKLGTIRQFGGISGFPRINESETDAVNSGHASTSVSAALGYAMSRQIQCKDNKVFAVIGDGSLSGGEAFEGLSNAAEAGTNMIIVVNDNEMSIAENHGGLYQNLQLLRESGGQAACNYFRALGLDYIYVEKGNDLPTLITAFKQVKDSTHPIVVHIHTQKGKGFAPAERDKERFHWSMPFDLMTGAPKVVDNEEDYGELTGEFLIDQMNKDPKVVAITSGTPAVFGFSPERRKKAGRQFVDVGIAEEHAVALASGIAAGGGRPVYGVYSTFIQRTYDQLSQDLCINNNPAVICVFAASVWGMNDVTHLGIFDIPLIGNVPNMVYLAPTCKEEYFAMLQWAMQQTAHPVAIRVPGNGVISSSVPVETDYGTLDRYKVTQQGDTVAIIALGSFFALGENVARQLQMVAGITPTLINPRYITGLDNDLLDKLKTTHRAVITLEDGILDGGFGEKIARYYGNSDMRVLNYGLKKEFVDRYNASELLLANRLTDKQITEDIIKSLQ